IPSAAPSKVGTATDHPPSPIIPKPDQTVCVTLRCALSLRVSFAPTCRMKAVSPALDIGASTTMKLREAAHESAFQLRQHRTNLLLPLVDIHKLPLHRLAQFTEIHTANCVAHRDEHIRASLNQHTLIDSHVNFAFCFSFKSQYPRCQPRHTIEPMRQQSKRTLARLRHDALHAGFLGEDSERQENLKIHECRRHVRPSVEVSPRAPDAARAWLWPETRRQASGRSWLRFLTQVRLRLQAGRVSLFPSLRLSSRSCRARSPGSL